MSQGYIHIVNKGDFSKTEKFFTFLMKGKGYLHVLDKYGKRGVEALSRMTPVDTGKTANSWSYEILQNGSGYEVVWTNSNINKGVNIALILQYGHGTRNGGWVEGVDYINPALRSIFQNMADEAWEVIVDYV